VAVLVLVVLKFNEQTDDTSFQVDLLSPFDQSELSFDTTVTSGVENHEPCKGDPLLSYEF